MATIRLSCWNQGVDFELRSPDLQIARSTDGYGGFYAFDCPVCGRREVHRTEPRIVELLEASGVPSGDFAQEVALSMPFTPEPDAVESGALVAFYDQVADEPSWMSELRDLNGDA